MQTVIERLRASKIQHEDQYTAAGRAAGRRWAEQRAEYPALCRVAHLDAHKADALTLARALHGGEVDWNEAEHCLEALGPAPVSMANDELLDRYFAGVVLGAREVLEAVEDAI